MIKALIVEDNLSDLKRIGEFINQYSKENKVSFALTKISDGLEATKLNSFEYEVAFLDIELPSLSGIEIAKHIREVNNDIIIVFITNMAHLAIKGYEVQALDFVLKPIEYAPFSVKLKKIINMITSHEEVSFYVTFNNSTTKISSNDVYYIDIYNHKICFHTKNGEFYQRGSLSDIESSLTSSFIKINSGQIVNYKFINTVKSNIITMSSGEILQIARGRKEDFYKNYALYVGGSFK